MVTAATQVPGAVTPTCVIILLHPPEDKILACIVSALLTSYIGRLLLQVMPLFIENSRVPPVPETVPMAILPPLNIQLTQVLLVMARLPIGGGGVTQTVGLVIPTIVMLLLHPLDDNTLA